MWHAVDSWTCHVEQRHFGHEARKATWLYAVGVELPSLPWGPGAEPDAWVSWANADRYPDRKRIGKKAAAATPPEFRDVLLAMARSARE